MPSPKPAIGHAIVTTKASETLNKALIAALYAEALLLADEARAWFDYAMGSGGGDALAPSAAMADDLHGGLLSWAGRHDPSLRIALSCESLRLTTRLMHIIAWLLLQRAIALGEVPCSAAQEAANRLGPSPTSDLQLRGGLPAEACRLIETSERLHARVARMDAAMDMPVRAAAQTVHTMLGRLQSAL